jgi:hypothetical protein
MVIETPVIIVGDLVLTMDEVIDCSEEAVVSEGMSWVVELKLAAESQSLQYSSSSWLMFQLQ